MRRIKRLLRHYQRITDDRAGALATAQQALSAVHSEIASLQQVHAAVNLMLRVESGKTLDLALARTMDAYKMELRQGIEALRRRLPAAMAEVDARRREVVEAQRTQKAWEFLRDRVLADDAQDELRASLLEADDMILRARCQRPAAGNTVPLAGRRG